METASVFPTCLALRSTTAPITKSYQELGVSALLDSHRSMESASLLSSAHPILSGTQPPNPAFAQIQLSSCSTELASTASRIPLGTALVVSATRAIISSMEPAPPVLPTTSGTETHVSASKDISLSEESAANASPTLHGTATLASAMRASTSSMEPARPVQPCRCGSIPKKPASASLGTSCSTTSARPARQTQAGTAQPVFVSVDL